MDTLLSLCDRYAIDMAHANHVAALADKLFDELEAQHGLAGPAASNARHLLRAGALLHNIAVVVDEENHHIVGRDIVAGSRISEFDDPERLVIACIVGFHRKTVKPKQDSVYLMLDEPRQRLALILSALCRIADGLDYSHSQSTQIRGVKESAPAEHKRSSKGEHSVAAILVKTQGPHSLGDASRATRKADLWGELFQPLRCVGKGEDRALTGADLISDAARVIFSAELGRFQPSFQWTSPEDLDAKSVKALRVANRRMRTLVRVFEPSFKPRRYNEFRRGLKEIADLLGRCREADHLLSSVSAYQAACDENAHQAFQPMIEAWQADRKDAQHELLKHLSKAGFQSWFRNAVEMFTTDSSLQLTVVGQPTRVRHVAYAWLWEHLSAVQAFDEVTAPTPAQLHELRVHIKRLRYLAKALSGPLPEDEMDGLVAACIAAQDLLGAINDAETVANHTLQFISFCQSKGKHLPLRAIQLFAEEQRRISSTAQQTWRSALEPLLLTPSRITTIHEAP